MPDISVIIPVFNAEKTLENTIDSALNQTYGDIEVILIDDGSTDSSGVICDRKAAEDGRVKVRHIENGGVANARNIALGIASGKYISFLDSDDIMEKNMLKHLLDNIKKYSTGLSSCGIIVDFKNSSYEHGFTVTGVINGSNMEKVLRSWFDIYMLALWNKLFRAGIIKENNITFKKDMSINEDGVFIAEYFRRVDSAFFDNAPLYHYVQTNADSLTARFNPDSVRCIDILIDTLSGLIEEKGLNPGDYEKMLFEKHCSVIDSTVYRMFVSDNALTKEQKQKLFNKWLADKKVRRYFAGSKKLRRKLLGSGKYLIVNMIYRLYGIVIKRRRA